MNDEQIKELIKELPKTASGQALQIYLTQALEELDSVSDCKSWDEVLGRKHAVGLIKDLFKMFKFEKVARKSNTTYT